MSKQDYYETLGVARGVSDGDLKKAFRTLAKKYHPDANPGDPQAEQKFKEVSEAYEVLSDPEKRAAYERFGHAAFETGGPGGGGFDFNFGGGFADIFEEMFGGFGGGHRERGAARGADLRYNMEITLEEAFKGLQKRIKVPTWISCGTCQGSGAAKGARPHQCGTCHGHGKVRSQQGFFTVERTCPACGGNGQVIDNPCGDCRGAGRVQKDKTLSVNIPAGIEDGARIRLAGEGEAGVRGAPAGDLYIFLRVRPHRFFVRDGAHIHCRVPIPMITAALGGSIEVPTLGGGRARVSIPGGTQTGAQFRLKSKGMPVMRGNGTGDMYIEAVVETPVNLTKRQKELLEQFASDAPSAETSPQSEGFFSKVRELWEDLRD